jgi:hypothetical protein
MTEPLSSSVQTGTVGLNQIITPRISNEIRANYSNDRVGAKYSLDHFGGAVPRMAGRIEFEGISFR